MSLTDIHSWATQRGSCDSNRASILLAVHRFPLFWDTTLVFKMLLRLGLQLQGWNFGLGLSAAAFFFMHEPQLFAILSGTRSLKSKS